MARILKRVSRLRLLVFAVLATCQDAVLKARQGVLRPFRGILRLFARLAIQFARTGFPAPKRALWDPTMTIIYGQEERILPGTGFQQADIPKTAFIAGKELYPMARILKRVSRLHAALLVFAVLATVAPEQAAAQSDDRHRWSCNVRPTDVGERPTSSRSGCGRPLAQQFTTGGRHATGYADESRVRSKTPKRHTSIQAHQLLRGQRNTGSEGARAWPPR